MPTITVPALLKAGIDPYVFPLPTEGYPEAATAIYLKDKTRFSDGFFEGIVKLYPENGRRYAKKIAVSRGVSERNVVSWIQKAGARGIRPKTRPGSRGGAPASAREKPRRNCLRALRPEWHIDVGRYKVQTSIKRVTDSSLRSGSDSQRSCSLTSVPTGKASA